MRRLPVQVTAAAAAATTAVALLLPLSEAHALTLGRVSVRSALGEPLRAEVEVTQVTPEEAASLRAAPAAPEAFRAAGIDRHPALTELRVTPERLSDGRFVLRLASDRVVNEPVIDLLLEATWAAGRIVRDYTLLFDPAAGTAQAPAAPATPPAPVTAAQLPPLPTTAGLAPGESAAAAAAAPPATAATPAPAATPATAPATPAPATQAATPAPTRVTVRAGDTAGKIVGAAKPASVSLEQMLVALLRANPDAFVGNNMNRLKTGAVLELPATEAAAAIEAREARRTVIAQSQDFNEFRRRLAERANAAPAAPATGTEAPAAGRQAAGKVEARVEDKAKRPADTTPDRLTLSKGEVQGRAGATPGKPAASGASAPRPGTEERIARQRATQDATQRQAELERNIAELSRLTAGAGPAASAATSGPAAGAASRPASSASAAGLALSPLARPAASAASAQAAGPAGTASAPASAASAASAPAEAASQAASAPELAASAASTASAAQAPASAPADSRPALGDRLAAALSDIGNNPWPLAIGAAVVAGLGAMAGLVWWNRRRSTGKPAKPAAGPAKSTRNSLRRPTAEETRAGGAAAAPALGALTTDAGAESDPLAEADVYLAYGRDLQAEEILLEVLRATPDRLPAITRQLEVLARRFDWEAFEPLARRALGLTGGRGPEWARIVELGRGLAPVGHPLFNGGASAADLPPAATEPTFEPPARADTAPAFAPQAPAPAAESPANGPAGLDLDVAGFRMPAPPAQPAPEPEYDPDIDGLFEGDLSAGGSGRASTPAAPGAPMEFDLAGLSLDLGAPEGGAAAGEADPLATKLSLAEEFRSIGDTEGARSLLEEVRDQAQGDLRARAERLLAELG